MGEGHAKVFVHRKANLKYYISEIIPLLFKIQFFIFLFSKLSFGKAPTIMMMANNKSSSSWTEKGINLFLYFPVFSLFLHLNYLEKWSLFIGNSLQSWYVFLHALRNLPFLFLTIAMVNRYWIKYHQCDNFITLNSSAIPSKNIHMQIPSYWNIPYAGESFCPL